MQNEPLQMKCLAENPDLLRIAMDWEAGLAKRFGYDGHSAFVVFWEDGETDTLRWYDGAFGDAGELETWRDWRARREIRIALRGIPLVADFTERCYGLLFDRISQRYYVGRLEVLRPLIEQLAAEQGMSVETERLLASLGIDGDQPERLTEQQLVRLLWSINQGGINVPPDQLH